MSDGKDTEHRIRKAGHLNLCAVYGCGREVGDCPHAAPSPVEAAQPGAYDGQPTLAHPVLRTPPEPSGQPGEHEARLSPDSAAALDAGIADSRTGRVSIGDEMRLECGHSMYDLATVCLKCREAAAHARGRAEGYEEAQRDVVAFLRTDGPGYLTAADAIEAGAHRPTPTPAAPDPMPCTAPGCWRRLPCPFHPSAAAPTGGRAR